jgi:hypothetical protein
MNTKIEEGLYQDEDGRVCEVVPHPEEGRGWIAYDVYDIVRRVSTSDGASVRVLRESSPPTRVTLESWALLKPFYVEPPAPLAKDLRKVVAAVRAVNEGDGAVAA